MSSKKKLIISISSLCLIAVIAVVSLVTVLAVLNKTFNIGGSIGFDAQNVYATVEKVSLTTGTMDEGVEDTKFATINIDAENEGDEAIATWEGLELNFPKSGEDVVLVLRVTNNSEENALNVTVGDITTTKIENATITVAIEGESAGTKTTSIAAKTGETAVSKTITITFSVTEKNESASIEGFNIPVTLATPQA